MAGKTFQGLGDAASPFHTDREQSDEVRGVYSGPTVVDEDKVVESLKKLRALDLPLGVPAAAPDDVTEAVRESVLDSSSSEPTRVADSAVPRPTAVGHSGSSSLPFVPQPMATQPLDAMRGTLFGHSIHLPEIAAPSESIEELSSRALVLVENESGPQPIAPFPLADRAPGGPELVERPLRTPRPASRDAYGESTGEGARSPFAKRIALGLGIIGGLTAGGAWLMVRNHNQRMQNEQPIKTVATPPSPPPAGGEAPAAPDIGQAQPAAGAQPLGEPQPASVAAAANAEAPRPGTGNTEAQPAAAAAPPSGAPAAEEPAPRAGATDKSAATATQERKGDADEPTPPAINASGKRHPDKHATNPERKTAAATTLPPTKLAAPGAAPAEQSSKPAKPGKRRIDDDPDDTLPPSLE